jgi:hypothetical protein
MRLVVRASPASADKAPSALRQPLGIRQVSDPLRQGIAGDVVTAVVRQAPQKERKVGLAGECKSLKVPRYLQDQVYGQAHL